MAPPPPPPTTPASQGRGRARHGRSRAATAATMGAVADEIDRRLVAAGHRWTTGRRQVVDVFVRTPQPLSVQDLVERCDGVPLSSMYRILASLLEARVVVKLGFDAAFAHYELDESLREHHHHLACRACGSVTDVDLADLEALLGAAARSLRARHGFRADAHRLDFFGTCARCS